MLKLKEGFFEFFGSTASLFDKYSSADLGVSAGSLNNYFYLHKGENVVYENAKCIIVKSYIYTKNDNRGKRSIIKKEEETE